MRKTFHFAFILILMLISNIPVFAGETGKISGHVSDKKNKESLMGVNITIVARWESGVERKITGSRGAATDKEGDYYILNVPPGVYSVRASYIGYKSEIITQIRVDVDKSTNVDFLLESTSFESKEVVVTAYSSKKVEQDLTATKQVYNIDDITASSSVSSLTDILELQADVVDDHFRGGRVGQSSFLVNGATISNPLTNSRAFSPITTALSQVEVYTSGFSAEYGNAQSGVVNMIEKEGGETWETRFEPSTSLPYYKTFTDNTKSGGSVYSPNSLHFYNVLKNDMQAWLAIDPTQGKQLFAIPSSFTSSYKPLNYRDTLALARLTQIMWLSSIRKVGLEYNNRFDSRFDFSTGGPLAEGLKLFIAARQEAVNPLIPTNDPNMERQLMGNVTYEPNSSDKFKVNFILASQSTSVLDAGGWTQWMFQPTTSVTRNRQLTDHIGLEWKTVYSPSIFSDIKLNFLNIRTEDNIEIINPGQFADSYTKLLQWTDYTGPSTHSVADLQSSRGVQRLHTSDLQGSMNVQFNKYNLLKSGLQVFLYDLDVDRMQGLSNASSAQKVKFHNYPIEGAAYLQDKLEFDGFISNIGLRFDFYDFNTEYYSNIYSPLRNPFTTGISDEFSATLAARSRTKMYTRLQPRIGFSFPLSETSVFHLNYGTFTQKPSFAQVFYNQVSPYGDVQFLGNPRLRPENTRAYDIGVINAFPSDIKVEISAYYKDVTDLIETSNFLGKEGRTYKTYTNREYADIKGMILNMEKSQGQLRGYVKYNYESAKGKNSNDLASPVTYIEGAPTAKLTSTEDVYLDYDRSHKMIANLQYITNSDDGFRMFDIYPLGNMSISATFKFYSGRPYTWDATGQGLQYNKRTPNESELRIKIQKSIKYGKTGIQFYLEGFNLLNTVIYNYGNIFNNLNSSYNLTKWEADQGNIRTYDEWDPYVTDQSIFVITNQPRYFRVGVIFKF